MLFRSTLLFFLLGILASSVKSDLEIPQQTAKFISIYLLFSIGFKGGQELQHAQPGLEIVIGVMLGVIIASAIPLYAFFLLKRRLGVSNAGAVAAAYGSVSAITFITAVSYLELNGLTFDGYMVAVMAIMELPAIVVAFFLMQVYESHKDTPLRFGHLVRHSLTNGKIGRAHV